MRNISCNQIVLELRLNEFLLNSQEGVCNEKVIPLNNHKVAKETRTEFPWDQCSLRYHNGKHFPLKCKFSSQLTRCIELGYIYVFSVLKMGKGTQSRTIQPVYQTYRIYSPLSNQKWLLVVFKIGGFLLQSQWSSPDEIFHHEFSISHEVSSWLTR